MAEDVEATPEADDGEETEAPKGRFAGKKKLIMIAGGALVLLLAGGGGAFFLMGGEDPPAGQAAVEGAEGAPVAEAAEAAAPGSSKSGYVGLPNMLVNLSSGGDRQVYLRIEATLELSSGSDVSDARDRSDAIVDGFQTFLREMRPRDISGSGGLLRLKEELLVRANEAIGRDVVRNVFLTEFLIQ